jgi:hypothetical protein
MPSRRRSTVLGAIGVAVATVVVLAGCTANSAVGESDLVGKWVSDSGSTLRLGPDGQARFNDFPRGAMQLNAVGAPVSATASWHVARNSKDVNLVDFAGKDSTWSGAVGASWTATLTDDSPRRLVFALQDPGLEAGKDLVLQRNQRP